MSLLLVGWAFAAELPWECPPIVDVADATVYRDTDAGLNAEFARLYTAAYAYWDDACAWVETTTEGAKSLTTERVCVADGSVVTLTETDTNAHDYGAHRSSTWRLVVEVPSGETWTRIDLTRTDSSYSHGSYTTSRGQARSASWEGAFAGLPDDEAFRVSYEGSTTYSGSYSSRGVEAGSCAFQWSFTESGGESWTERVSAAGHAVSVHGYYYYTCGVTPWMASLDGATVGLVDRDTWERDLSDADGDGIPAGVCDCDDTDAARNTMAYDIPNDGIDQDCDGVDLVDWDADDDGHDDPAFGGDDCDDTDATIHPGADDGRGDGIDQDCDGADDVDVDRDGYTVDGDDRPPDCDDTSTAIAPTRTEIECDGIDQNCDGVDDCPPPAEEPREEEEEDVEEDVEADAVEDGCAGASAWLLVAPLLGLRRRRADRAR